VTGFTESHEVACFIAATFGQRKDVVYLLGRSQPALFLALLAQRVCFDVTVTDTLPCTAVPPVGGRVTFDLVVMFVHQLLMLGAVLLVVCKPTAAGISTGTFGFVRHWFTSFWA